MCADPMPSPRRACAIAAGAYEWTWGFMRVCANSSWRSIELHAARTVNVQILKWILVRRVVFVADDPRLDDDVFDPKRRQHPRRVRAHDFRHPSQALRALRRIGHRARLLVETIVFRQLEAREI